MVNWWFHKVKNAFLDLEFRSIELCKMAHLGYLNKRSGYDYDLWIETLWYNIKILVGCEIRVYRYTWPIYSVCICVCDISIYTHTLNIDSLFSLSGLKRVNDFISFLFYLLVLSRSFSHVLFPTHMQFICAFCTQFTSKWEKTEAELCTLWKKCESFLMLTCYKYS